MAILPTDFTLSATPKGEGAPVLEPTLSTDDHEVFGATFRDLLNSSDDNRGCTIVGNCTRSIEENGNVKVSAEQSDDDPVEASITVNVAAEELTPDNLDFLTLKMVEISRSSRTLADEAPGIESSELLQVVAMRNLTASGTVLKDGIAQLMAVNSPSNADTPERQLLEATDRFSIAAPAMGMRTEGLGVDARAVDVSKGTIKTEPQQFAVGMTAQIRLLKSQGGGEARLNLHPADLGRMSIAVSTEGTDTRISFVVETSQARQVVETALPRLRDLLDNAGLSLSDSDVSEQRDHHDKSDQEGSDRQRNNIGTAGGDDTSSEISISLGVDPDRLIDTYI